MGMVVRTNTMALNAYRQLGMNNNAVAKSLEKLASGYRINRAGDDAAGLAISEKMKAQITGLETASANAQDGISLIQTAEGNLNEVHDMLNRMVELASKSANGTYTSQERQALQDEMDQLLDEIDRISQSANFNGRKLLDGSMSDEIKTTGATDVDTLEILTDGQQAANAQPGVYSIDFSNASITNQNAGTAAVTAVYTEAVTAATTDGGKVTIAGVAVAIPGADGDNADLENQLALWKEDANAADVLANYDVTLNAAKDGVIFTAKKAGEVSASGAGPNTAPGGNATVSTAGADEKAAKTIDATFKIFGKDLTLAGLAGGATKGADLAKLVADAWNAQTGTNKQLHGVDAKATVEGDKVIFTMAKAPESLNETFAATTGQFKSDATITDPDGNTITGVTGAALIQNNGHEVTVTVVKEPVGESGRLYGQAQMTLKDTDIVDGKTLKIGDTTYVFAVGSDSKYKNAANVVDLTDKKAGVPGIANDAAARLSTAAADNKNFKVGTTVDSGVVTFTEREGGVDYSVNNLAGKNGKGTYTANGTGLGTTPGAVDATPDDWAGLIMMGMADVNSSTEALTLQIGDTADPYNKMSVSVRDMSANGLGLAGLKKVGIMTESSASDAIDTIKNAINTVSSTRAGLGALQNRLEHTINNLDVAAENLSAANSRIRDTDMAKEMMNYTKMNVLVQSAQAMLAQANQQPQSVLQLLQ